MSASDSGSGKTRRGRGVTRVADVTSKRVDGQRRHVDIDLRSEVDKNLLWQDIQFTRPQKQSIHDTVIHEDDDMAIAEDDPLSKLMTKLPRLKKAPLELYWDLRVFGIPPHVPVYITLSDALEMIGGDRMLNISITQLWCMYMDTIVVDQGRSSMYRFVEPQTIQPSGNTLQNRQQYLQTWMDEVIGKSRGQLVKILYPKDKNQDEEEAPTGSSSASFRPKLEFEKYMVKQMHSLSTLYTFQFNKFDKDTVVIQEKLGIQGLGDDGENEEAIENDDNEDDGDDDEEESVPDESDDDILLRDII
ncbi:hypothetical protein LR48_Vigan04g079100 [Vigna angularis]|uniref:Uncharacterized protein n=1 Tax=Phaseolus angularis TaxID=3914 RepID=A0A0L9UCW0_PHAAN|nr:hypothetical protein LR48_Vigan04g079100 [Vigna angularis]